MMAWWLLSIAVCFILHQAFENRGLQSENSKLREAVTEAEGKATDLKRVTDGAVAITAYVVAAHGGRIEVPAWIHRCQWELRSKQNPELGTVVFTTTELLQ